ncbi:MAG: F0F1 ATP synthase subunit delta [Proteiniphilum sp.]|jgi:F-type H+-transporting ATPase subunit delta|nr:F0F1 ATP synthase subunit delta [Proteiniphilum sp.]
MNASHISSRYANALLQYALGLGQEREVYDRMTLLAAMFMKLPALRDTVMNPSLPRRERENILVTACGGGDAMPSSLPEMIGLIMRNEREDLLQHIALRFIDLYRDKFNIRSGRLVTAFPVDRETERRLVDRVRNTTESEVEMECTVDPGIIGGFVLTLDDRRWDASISGELSRIRRRLLTGKIIQ